MEIFKSNNVLFVAILAVTMLTVSACEKSSLRLRTPKATGPTKTTPPPKYEEPISEADPVHTGTTPSRPPAPSHPTTPPPKPGVVVTPEKPFPTTGPATSNKPGVTTQPPRVESSRNCNKPDGSHCHGSTPTEPSKPIETKPQPPTQPTKPEVVVRPVPVEPEIIAEPIPSEPEPTPIKDPIPHKESLVNLHTRNFQKTNLIVIVNPAMTKTTTTGANFTYKRNLIKENVLGYLNQFYQTKREKNPEALPQNFNYALLAGGDHPNHPIGQPFNKLVSTLSSDGYYKSLETSIHQDLKAMTGEGLDGSDQILVNKSVTALRKALDNPELASFFNSNEPLTVLIFSEFDSTCEESSDRDNLHCFDKETYEAVYATTIARKIKAAQGGYFAPVNIKYIFNDRNCDTTGDTIDENCTLEALPGTSNDINFQVKSFTDNKLRTVDNYSYQDNAFEFANATGAVRQRFIPFKNLERENLYLQSFMRKSTSKVADPSCAYDSKNQRLFVPRADFVNIISSKEELSERPCPSIDDFDSFVLDSILRNYNF